MKALLILGFSLGVTTSPPEGATLTFTVDSETSTTLTSNHCAEENISQSAKFTLTTDSTTPALVEDDKLYIWWETSDSDDCTTPSSDANNQVITGATLSGDSISQDSGVPLVTSSIGLVIPDDIESLSLTNQDIFNRVDTDACTNTCQPARCGDGIVRLGQEACDDGNANELDGCTTQCEVLNPPQNCSFVADRTPITVRCSTARNWTQAQAACVAWGGNLVTVADQQDQNLLWAAAQRRAHWIGLHQNNRGNWVWAGRASNYRRWGQWQPDNWGGGEDCVELWPSGSGRWNDAPCNNQKRYLCER